MKVSLFHNPDAGEENRPHPLPEMLARHGHEVVMVVAEKGDAPRLLEQPCDLFVAAGGDGTVGLAARTVAHRGVPMAILPIGTANNIALTLGVEGSVDDLISGWTAARHQHVDVGYVRMAGGTESFVESVGIGLMAAGIAEATSASFEQMTQPLSNLTRTAQIYRTALDRLQPRHCTIDADGRRIEGEFLLIEVLNMRFVGPHLVFAPRADPSDGVFEIAVASGDERDALDEYLRHRLEGTDCPLSLMQYRARRIELDTADWLHIDDRLHESDGNRVTLEISGQAVTVLV